jgi:hypothetical protein
VKGTGVGNDVGTAGSVASEFDRRIDGLAAAIVEENAV